jgi:putative transcriptional regulator
MIIEGNITNRLPVLRAEKGWSQAHLAEMVNVSRQTINSLEKNKYNPSLKLAFSLSVAFGVSITEVFQFEQVDSDKKK